MFKKWNLLILTWCIFGILPLLAQPTFTIQDTPVSCGATTASVDITVADFVDVSGMQFTVSWNPMILDYVSFTNLNTNLPGLFASNVGTGFTDQGDLTLAWIDGDLSGEMLDDDEILFTINFDIIGTIPTTIEFTENVTTILVTGIGSFPPPAIMANFESGVVSIGDNIAPTIECPAPVTVDTDPGTNTAVVNNIAPTSFSDDCGTPSVTYSTSGATPGLTGSDDISGETFNIGTTEITYTATDGGGNNSSCVFTVTVNDSNVGDVTFIAQTNTATCIGDGLSIDITVQNFIDITGAQFTISWNELILDFVSFTNLNPDLENLAPTNISTDFIDQGDLTFAWIDLTGEMLDDDAILFTINFNVLATGSSNINFTDEVTAILVTGAGLAVLDAEFVSGSGAANDTEAPTITCPDPVNMTVPEGVTSKVINDIAPVSVDDNCGAPVVSYSTSGATPGLTGMDDISGEEFNLGETVVTYTATDAFGLSSNCTFTITIEEDANIPTPTFTAEMTDVNCGESTVSVDVTVADFTNISGVQFTISWNENALSYINATDFNSTLAMEGPHGFGTIFIDDGDLTFFWTDGDLAGVSLPPDALLFTLNFNVLAPPLNTDIDFTDNVTLRLVSGTGAIPPPAIPAEYVSGSVTHIPDTEVPSITCPDPITINCEDSTDPTNTGSATAMDNCTMNITPTFTDVEDLTGCSNTGTITRTWIADDGNGNTNSCTQVITIEDNSNPTFDSSPTAIADIECGGTLPTQETLTASDNCGMATVVGTIDPFTVNACDGYSVTHRWTATDNCDNSTVTSITFNVLPDDTDPTFDSSPVAITDVECGGTLPIQETLTASDNCGTATVVATVDPFTENTCDGYSVTYRWTATDDCDNSTVTSVTFSVLSDSSNPTFDSPPTAIADVACGADLPTQETLTASDNCGTATVVATVDPFTEDACNGYSVTYRWTATDECSNNTVTNVSFNVLPDNDNPTFDSPPTAIADVACGGALPTQETLTASDNCGAANVVASVNPFTESCDGYAVTHVWTATDDCGNSTVTSVSFNVLPDNANPTFDSNPTVIADIECGGTLPTQETLTASDNCGTATVVASVDPFTEDACNGYSVTYRWTATDECNNSAVTSVTFNVLPDDTNPTFDSNPTTIADIECGGTLPTQETLTASDNCGTATVVASVDPFTENACDGYSVTYRWTATDECNNSAVTSVTFNVLPDDTNPTFDSSPSTIADVNCGSTLPTQETLTASDNCGSATVDASVDPFTENICDGYTITYRWIATDDCGNTTVLTQSFNVLPDTDGPSFTAPGDIVLNCNEDYTDPAITGEVTGESDDCSTILGITFSDEDSGSTNCGTPSEVIRTWTVTDACGNTSTQTQVITLIEDTPPMPPTFTVPGPVTINCEDDPLDLTITGDVTDEESFCNPNMPQATFTDDITGTGCHGVTEITRIWELNDGCSSVTIQFQIITIVDEEAPTFTVPMSITINCGESTDVSNLGDVTDENDNCSINLEATFVDDLSGLTGCGGTGTLLRTWTLTDDCSNATTHTQTITIQDVIAPVFTPAATATISCETDITNLAITGEPTMISDGCDPNPATTYTDDDSGLTSCNGTGQVIRTWTVTDACNNATTATQTIVVFDNTPPTFTVPASLSIDCTESYTDLSVTGDVTNEGDNCSTGLEATFTDALSGSSLCFSFGLVTRTWTLTDDCGNTTTAIQTINVNDTGTDPLDFTVPIDVTISCDQDSLDLALTGDVTDETSPCTSMLDATFMDAAIVYDGCTGTLVRTWTLADGCSGTISKDQTITIVDEVAPTFDAPAAITVDCSIDVTDLSGIGSPTGITDNCLAILDPTFSDDNSALTGCNGTGEIIRTWMVSDECGNAATATQVITVIDETDPTFTVPADLTIPCNTDYTNLSITGDVTDEDDNCSTGLMATFVDVETGTTNCNTPSQVIRTWTLTDDCGNSISQDQIITIEDLPPGPIPPPSLTINCQDDPTDLSITGMVTGDISTCNPSAQATYTDSFNSPLGCNGTGEIIRTWTIDDDCSPVLMFTQIITIVDNEMPTFTVPANMTISCDADPQNLDFTGEVTDESDNCSMDLEATYTDNTIGLTGCNGTGQIVRTWTLIDDCNNTNTQIQIITVVDTTLPTFSAPAAVTLSCEMDVTDLSLTGDVTDEADNCSNNLEATYTDDNSGLTGCNGTGQILRTWSLTDDCGNLSTQTQLVTLVDNTPPSFTVPASIDFSCSLDFNDPALTGDVTDESDNCSTGLNATFTDVLIGSTDCANPGEIIRTWTLTDDCGNSVSGEQIINLVMGISSFTTPDDLTIECDDDPNDLSLTGDVTDELSSCNPNPEATYTDDLSGLTGCNGSGEIIRTWTLEDGCSGIVMDVQIITVLDQTAPVAACQDVTIALSASGMATITAEDIDNGSSDNCQDAATLIYTLSQTDFDCSHIGANPVTLTVTDSCGNASTCLATVTVEDNMSPEIDCILSDITVNVDAGSCVASNVWMPATGTDNCGVPVVTSSHDNNDVFSVGETVVTHTATDAAGNSTTCSYVVTVVDNEAPQLSCDQVQLQIVSVGNCQAMVNWTGVSATDNCMDDLVVSSTHNSGDLFPVGVVTTVEYTAMDASGNSATCSFDVNPVDEVPPTIACPEGVTLDAQGADCSTVYSWSPIVATDDCSAVTVTCTEISGSSFPIGTTTVICTATDGSGNMSTCSFDVTVEDNVAPVPVCFEDVEIQVDGTVISDPDGIIETVVPNADCSGLTITYTTPTATDDCTASVTIDNLNNPSGSLFLQGANPVEFSFTDDFGNTINCNWIIDVVPFSTAPMIIPLSGLTICEGDDLQLLGTGFIGTYTWTDPSNNTIVNDTLTLNDISAAGAGLYTLEVSVNGNCTLTETAMVTVNAVPDIMATSNSPICDGELSLTAAEMAGSVPVVAWDWQGACGIAANTANVDLTGLTDDCNGTYTIMATTADGCVASEEVEVAFVNLPSPNLSMACDPVLCISESCFLLGTEYNTAIPEFYNWAAAPNAGLPDETDQSSLEINPTETGEFTYEYWVDQDGCSSDTASITLTIVDRPILNDDQYVTDYQVTVETSDMTDNDLIIDQLADDINIFSLPSNGTISTNADGSYSYTPNNGFIGDDFFLYRICYNCDVSECDTARVDIRVDFTGECEVPNIITPNGDGVNDLLEISCIKTGDYPNSEMLIMNQWGDKVFHASPYMNDWDGTWKGKDGKGLPDATYYFIFKETPNSPGEKGYIMIQR